MVVSPRDLEGKLSENDERVLSRFEVFADKFLEERYFPGESVCIPAPSGAKNFRKVIETIKKKYRDAGWEVTYTSDQRDGDYLMFETCAKKQTQ